MALLMGITLPAGWEIIYNKTLRMYDISVMCNVGKNPQFFPRSRFHTLKEITYLYDIAYQWANLTTTQKDGWRLAGDVIGQHNFNLFTQDTSYRKKNGIGGIATPSIHHQYTVGHIKIESPANSAKIAQYNYRKIIFPAQFGISYRSNLTSAGANPYCRYKITYLRYTSGKTIEQTQTIEIPLVSAWNTQNENVVDAGDRKGKWFIEIELNDVIGDLWFDNVIVEYDGEIKINDSYCLDVVNYFKGENLPAGTTLETVYPPD